MVILNRWDQNEGILEQIILYPMSTAALRAGEALVPMLEQWLGMDSEQKA